VTGASDVVVVGGGAIGCAIACELAARGLSVALLERGEPGGEASWAAAGLLSPQSDAREPGPFFDLCLESRSLYAEWSRALEEETGLAVGYRTTGILRCACSEAEWESLQTRFRWQQDAGQPTAEKTAHELSRWLPGLLSPRVTGGVFLAEDGAVDSRLLTRALAVAAARRGVRVLPGREARRCLVERGVCRGVVTATEVFPAGAVVDATGAWAAFDPAWCAAAPVTPVRGQIVALRPEAPLPLVVEAEDVYLVPRQDGQVLAGATTEREGFRKAVTAEGVRSLTEAAIRLVPALSAARFETAWSGLRPGTPDGWPILGEAPGLPGLFFAAGHYRNGILLAPLSARIVGDLVTRTGRRDLSAFSPDRFASAPPESRRRGQFG
jgi:glycine oxidase